MAIVNEEALKNVIKTDKSNVFVLFGEDGYLKKLYVEKITKPLAAPDDIFNYQRFENGVELQEVYDAILQFPVLSDKKCVILRDFDFVSASSDDFEKLLTLIGETPDTTVFILWFDAFSFDYKKGRFKNILKACDEVNGCVVNLEHRRTAELEKMLLNGAIKRGCKMEITAAKYLIETAGDDIDTLSNELKKLCTFVEGGVITKETVESVSVKTVEADIYRLADKILNCDLSSAYAILDDLFFMRVEPIIILSTITAVYVDMHRVLSGKGHAYQNDKIASDFGYGNRAFTLKDATRNLKNFDFNKLNFSFKALAGADSQLKSFSGNDRVILEELIVKLSYIAAKGESVD